MNFLQHTDRQLPLQKIVFFLNSGLDKEPEDQQGVATLAHKMLFQGTSNRSKVEFQNAIADLGTDIFNGVYHDYSTISSEFLTENFDRVVALMHEVLDSPTFEKSEFEIIRKKIISQHLELETTADQHKAYLVLRDLAFKKQALYTKNILSKKEYIESATIEDVRSFYEKTLRNSIFAISCWGALEEAAVQETANSIKVRDIDLTKIGQSFFERDDINYPIFQKHLTPKPKVILISRPDRTTSYVYQSWPGVHPRDVKIHGQNIALPPFLDQLAQKGLNIPYLIFNLMNHYVGADFTSLLNYELREKRGLVYGVGTQNSLQPMRDLFMVQFATQTSSVVESLKVTQDTLQNLEKTFDKKRLEHARQKLILTQPFREEGWDRVIRNKTSEQLYGLHPETIERLPEIVATFSDEMMLTYMHDFWSTYQPLTVIVGTLQGLLPEFQAAFPDWDIELQEK